MKDRIREFLLSENKSSAQMANEIDVLPSSVSHILSGRNNPSLDFILKMLNRYQFLSTDWLLFGKGEMYKENKVPTLFDDEGIDMYASDNESDNDEGKNDTAAYVKEDERGVKEGEIIQERKSYSGVKKIVWFFNDNSFIEYYPRE